MSKPTPVEIYETLCKLFPGQYMPLRKVKESYPHPGPEPKGRPSESDRISFSIEITPDMSSQQMIEALASIPGNADYLRKHVTYVQTGVRSESITDYDMCGSFTRMIESPVYSDEVKCVEICGSYPNPDWKRLVEEAKLAKRSWQDKMRTYKERKDQRIEANAHNNQLIEAARKANPDRWASIGRYLKGKGDPNFLRKQRERLLEQADKLQEQIELMEQS